MSRLSRFKKPPTLKLPKKLGAGRFNDDSDDEDFKQPIRLEVKSKTRLPDTAVRNSCVSQTKQTDIASSFSRYFPPPKEEIKNANKKVVSQAQAPVGETAEKPGPSRKPAGNSRKEFSKSQEDDISLPKSENNINVSDDPNTILCPFCWKKLADKLTGTTHIKSCAKDFPIEQIHEAMLLQERQIEEWKKLGLNFPAFSVDKKRTKKEAAQSTRGRARGGRGRKKNEDAGGADPQLELAMALSVSLHEEWESRQQNENKFLIENGLDQEIGLVKVPSEVTSTTVASKKPMKTSSTEIVPSTTTTSRRRGKKLVLESLPLYTVGDLEKKNIIAERVTNILDKSMNEKKEDFFIRDALPAEVGKIPKRLQSLHNQECTLWNCAKSPPETPAEAYSVLDLDMTRPIEALKLSDTKPSGISDVRSDCAENPSNLHASSETTMETKTFNSINSPSKVGTGEAKPSKPFNTGIIRKHGRRSSSSSVNSKLLKLSPVICDIARMLFDGIESDIVLYGREERPIKCHRFMLSARCPKILSEIVVEESPNHPDRHIIPLTSYTHETVKAFVWYIYSGTVESSKESVLSDLQELGSTYDIKIITDLMEKKLKEEKSQEQTLTSYAEAEVQTEATSTKDSCSMTESNDYNGTGSGVSTNVNTPPAFLDHDNSSRLSSEELFETSSQGLAFSPVGDQQIGNISANSLCNEENNSTQLSVELFEDAENSLNAREEEKNPLAVVELEVSNCFNINENLQSSSSSKDSQNEDDDYFRDLASPVVHNSLRSGSSEKKRSRSVSPLVDTSMYTATQIANILQKRQDGESIDVTGLKKASKKLKLDQYSSFDANVEMDVVENNYCGLSDDCIMDKWDKTSSVVDSIIKTKLASSNVDSIQSTSVIAITPKTKNSSRMSRRSISTPNLTPITNSLHSPFYNPQEQEQVIPNDPFESVYDDYDPFGNGCDDSVFAKIPDDVFTCTNTKSQSSTKKLESSSQNKCKKDVIPLCHTTSTPPSLKHNLSMSTWNYSSQPQPSYHSYDDSASMKKKGNKKANPKEKPKPKLKLPKNISLVQEEASVPVPAKAKTKKAATQSYSSPIIADDSSRASNNMNATPLLNYSLIDTPILKQELKKYGIKPLPRSKAKVLLRHIYKETHK